jgi:hypothetical protein
MGLNPNFTYNNLDVSLCASHLIFMREKNISSNICIIKNQIHVLRPVRFLPKIQNFLGGETRAIYLMSKFLNLIYSSQPWPSRTQSQLKENKANRVFI